MWKPVDAAIEMVVGPLIDDTDFKAEETAIAYNAAGMDVDFIVEKLDGTAVKTDITLTTGGTSDWTHISHGYYRVEITAAQNTEEGVGYLVGICTGVLPFASPKYQILATPVYNALVSVDSHFGAIFYGSCTSDGTTTTIIDTKLTQAATDFWKGRIVIFTSGTLKYQATDITAFTPASDTLTVTALTGAPANGDKYVIL